jgi:hypothetical protein
MSTFSHNHAFLDCLPVRKFNTVGLLSELTITRSKIDPVDIVRTEPLKRIFHVLVLQWFDRKDRILYSHAIAYFSSCTALKACFLHVHEYL